MYSPVTGKPSPVVDSFPVPVVVEGYKKDIGIDVSPYFKGMDELPLYQCPDTKLRFFYPYSLAGDAAFYTALEDREAYYSEWKWEYDEAFRVVDAGAKVLDIGCGRGAFLAKLKSEKQCDVFGLEYNPSAYQVLQERSIPAAMESIEEHSKGHAGRYDVVSFFQVLEHIGDVKSFMDGAVASLKKNGLLIIAVPNNQPYLFGNNKYEWLNLPPHHMGWWNRESLTNLSGFFGLGVQFIRSSPFKDYNNYLDSLRRTTAITNPGRVPWLDLTRPFRKQWIQLFKNSIPGFFILAVYRKR
ncbi:MAG: class I SAM-dependent methyltransferase [Chitinophagaceae bacterium]